MVVCVCCYVHILCAENAGRLVCVMSLSVHKSVCTCVFALSVYMCVCVGGCVCLRYLALSLKVFPCVSNYYSVGGHIEARGDVHSNTCTAVCVCVGEGSVGQDCVFVCVFLDYNLVVFFFSGYVLQY